MNVRVEDVDIELIDGDFIKIQQAPIEAMFMNKQFELETSRGMIQGDPGDWIIKGVDDTLYVVTPNTMMKIYTIVCPTCNSKLGLSPHYDEEDGIVYLDCPECGYHMER
jgi:DNA-directed RNA polymerase subunit RPC12/RpoP